MYHGMREWAVKQFNDLENCTTTNAPVYNSVKHGLDLDRVDAGDRVNTLRIVFDAINQAWSMFNQWRTRGDVDRVCMRDDDEAARYPSGVPCHVPFTYIIRHGVGINVNEERFNTMSEESISVYARVHAMRQSTTKITGKRGTGVPHVIMLLLLVISMSFNHVYAII